MQAALFRYRKSDTLAFDNGGAPARPTQRIFGLLLPGVFRLVHSPGRTNPRLSEELLPRTSPAHRIWMIELIVIITDGGNGCQRGTILLHIDHSLFPNKAMNSNRNKYSPSLLNSCELHYTMPWRYSVTIEIKRPALSYCSWAVVRLTKKKSS